MFGCLHALHAKECGVGTGFFSDDEICWLAWMPFMRVPRVSLSTNELEQTCRNRKHFSVASSVVWVVPSAIKIK